MGSAFGFFENLAFSLPKFYLRRGAMVQRSCNLPVVTGSTSFLSGFFVIVKVVLFSLKLCCKNSKQNSGFSSNLSQQL